MHDKQIILLKSRQTGRSSTNALRIWYDLYMGQNRKEGRIKSIRKIFNI